MDNTSAWSKVASKDVLNKFKHEEAGSCVPYFQQGARSCGKIAPAQWDRVW